MILLSDMLVSNVSCLCSYLPSYIFCENRFHILPTSKRSMRHQDQSPKILQLNQQKYQRDKYLNSEQFLCKHRKTCRKKLLYTSIQTYKLVRQDFLTEMILVGDFYPYSFSIHRYFVTSADLKHLWVSLSLKETFCFRYTTGKDAHLYFSGG